MGGGNPFDTDPNTGETDSDTDVDTDTDADFEATIAVALPEDAPADVYGVVDGDALPAEACDGATCIFTAEEAGTYEVSLESEYVLYRVFEEEVLTPGEYAVEFNRNGCTDTEWDPLGSTPCEEFVPGDYGTYVDATCENTLGDDDYDVRVRYDDLDEDGLDEIVIDLDFTIPMSGNMFQGEYSGGLMYGEILDNGDISYKWSVDGVTRFEYYLDCP